MNSTSSFRRIAHLKFILLWFSQTILALLISACSFQITPQVLPETLSPSGQRLDVTIMLDMPAESVFYEYVASFDNREIRYYFGKSLNEYFAPFLQSLFRRVALKGTVPPQADYDFIVIPSFVNTNSYTRFITFAVEPTIKIEFLPRNKDNGFSVIGTGHGETHFYKDLS